MTEPEDGAAAGGAPAGGAADDGAAAGGAAAGGATAGGAAAGGRGRMLAGRADRDEAVDLLKTAYVQERLTKDELDARVARALAARTYADLAAVTADIPPEIAAAPVPAVPAAVLPAAAPASTPARTLGRAVRRTGMCLAGSLVLIAYIVVTHPGTNPSPFDILALWGVIMGIVAASGFLGYGVIDAVTEWRAGRAGGSRPGGLAPGGPPFSGPALGSSGPGDAGPASAGPDGARPAGPQASGAARDGSRPGGSGPGGTGPAGARPGGARPGRAAQRGAGRLVLLAGLVVNLGGRGVLLHRLDPAQR
jgi:Domain of unknown function (DUF1707)